MRNNLDDPRTSDRDLAEQARLLGGIDSQPSRDINVRFEGDTNVSGGGGRRRGPAPEGSRARVEGVRDAAARPRRDHGLG